MPKFLKKFSISAKWYKDEFPCLVGITLIEKVPDADFLTLMKLQLYKFIISLSFYANKK
jgi:hypothetical protein